MDGDGFIGTTDIEHALKLLTQNELSMDEIQCVWEKVNLVKCILIIFPNRSVSIQVAANNDLIVNDFRYWWRETLTTIIDCQKMSFKILLRNPLNS